MKFTIRDLLWLTVIVAVAAELWNSNSRYQQLNSVLETEREAQSDLSHELQQANFGFKDSISAMEKMELHRYLTQLEEKIKELELRATSDSRSAASEQN